ncbi:MAG: NAD(+) kinase [Gammaproteobacteria bacterium]
MPDAFNTIGLIGRYADPPVRDTVQQLVPMLSDAGVRVLIADEIEDEFGSAKPDRIAEKSIPAQSDLVISIGGDGTMLYAARLVADHGVPLLGINRGRLGFLADISPEAITERISELLDGRFIREQRMMLDVAIVHDDVETAAGRALNDVVVQKWSTSRMLEFEIWIDGRYVNVDRGDGLIVATPTGSTAYALSGGGPILHPQLDAAVLVPICPHTLSDRPLVLSPLQTLDVRLIERAETHAQLIIDGFSTTEMRMGDAVRIRCAKTRLELMHPPDYDYYKILRSKLAWGRGDSANTTV